MARAPKKQQYIPKNAEKYIGTLPIVSRSSWEFDFMRKIDENPSVLKWASESIAIPYIHPFDKRRHLYYPDFFIIYMDSRGKPHAEVVEIKPISQSLMERAKTQHDQIQLIVNTAKWQAAEAYCKRRGYTFRILTEEQLYGQAMNAMGARGPYSKKSPRETVPRTARKTPSYSKRTRKTLKKR